MKATGSDTPGTEQVGLLHAPPSIKNNPNVLPMPAELFNTGDIPQFYSSTIMVALLDEMPNDLPYGGFDDTMDTFHDNMGLPVRSQPHPPMNNFSMGNRMRGGMQRHHPKPRMGGRGGKSMVPRIPHHGGNNPRMQMGSFQPY